MWTRFKRYFFSGLLAILPISLTLIIIVKIFRYLINFVNYYLPFNKIIQGLIDSNSTNELLLNFSNIISYLLSIIITIFLILLVGFIAFHYVDKEKVKWFEGLFLKIPFSKTIYSTVKQISQIILSDEFSAFRKVVIIEYPKAGIYSLGFLTNPNVLIKGKEKENHVAVFIPTAPNPTTGMFVFIKKEELINLEMRVEEAIKIIISGGAISPDEIKKGDL